MKLKNTYYILRHGEALHNVKNINSSWPETFENPLTEEGALSVRQVAGVLKNNHAQHGRAVDMIVASDLLRTKQTAGIIAEELGLPIAYDRRLREIDFGSMNGKPWVGRVKEDSDRGVDGESYEDVLARMKDFLDDIEKNQENRHILIISHQANLWLLENFVKGKSLEEAIASAEPRISRGELRELHAV